MSDWVFWGLPGWFLLGISMGFGPCVSHNLLLILPYVGLTRSDARSGLVDFIKFSLARMLTHAGLGLAGAIIGSGLHQWLAQEGMFRFGRIAVGLLLILISISTLFRQSFACRYMHGLLLRKPGRTMFVAGALTVLTPCPAVLGLVLHSASVGRLAYGAIAGFLFALGSSVSPLLVLAPLKGFIKGKLKSPKVLAAIRYANAFILFGYGFHLFFF